MNIFRKTTGPVLVALAAVSVIPIAAVAQEGRGSGQTNYHLMQLTVKSDQVSLEDFSAQAKKIRSCNDAKQAAKTMDADIKRDRFVMPHQLPSDLKAELEETPTGHATKVFSADPTLMRVIVICHRV
ncbi:hypothetical protein BPTFM16_00446 [Altererythrobacter insulae]|nr:hypothetical protein BPTFM16_00446 [Altererythrobacter insulae]